MIRRWCAAMGERNPAYLDEQAPLAPPAMLEVWTMRGFTPDGSGGAVARLTGIDEMDAAGFTAVVATNLSQEYVRYLHPGDLVTQQVTFVGVSDQKQTALGPGHFLDYRYEFTDQRGEVVGRMRFRILKYRPTQVAAAAPAAMKPPHPRPAITADSAFFWDGLNQRRLLIRRCGQCARLHHPPGPMCPVCHSQQWSVLEASGRGTVHSYVIVHQPQMPGFRYPLPVALVDLEEGVRLVANLSGVGPEQVRIGMPVEVEFNEVEPGYVLYAFHPRAGG
ncbi:MAG: bifunctional MaoC family dehydratase/OB-fold nucleic acid binding domain-containing protein [Proteobacteria bacterium]|nr:bifunctional MaoC family dehydratase/OB-fold nucleic acid binding domain-containing protein [Pseudomonadota bacterium]